jgi:hypothetical protein
VRQLAATPSTGEGWPERMLAQLGRLHLLVEAYGRLDALDEATRADVRARIGFPLGDAELASAPPVRDAWVVLGQVVEDEERLRARRVWLHGARTGRRALLLDFAFGTAAFAEPVPPVGATLDATLVFHPASCPQRAVLRERPAGRDAPSAPPPGEASLAAATLELSRALARDPWVERVAVVLDQVVPEHAAAGWVVRDAAGDALPLSPRFRDAWPLVALAGGRPVWLSAEWDGATLLPLAAAANGAPLVPLAAGEAA